MNQSLAWFAAIAAAAVLLMPAGVSSAPLALGNAATDFTQGGFDINSTIDGTGVRSSSLSGAGWAINAGGANRQAVYETAVDFSPTNGSMKFDIYHFFTSNNFMLGRYRIYVTDSDRSTFASGGNNAGAAAVGTANWSLVTPTSVVGDTNGYSFAIDPNGISTAEVNVINTSPSATGRYTVIGQTNLTNITGIRLEALTQTNAFPLPSLGPGRNGNGNFVLTEFQAYDSPGTFVAQRLVSADQLEHRNVVYAGNLGNGGGDQIVADSFGRSTTFVDNTASVITTAHGDGSLASGIASGNLSAVLNPLGFTAGAPGAIGGTVNGLTPDTEYRVQLLFNGTGQNARMSNITVNGQLLENYEIPNGSSIVTARVRTGVGQSSLSFDVSTPSGGASAILSAVTVNAIPQGYVIDDRFDDQNYAVNVLGTGTGWDAQRQGTSPATGSGSIIELDGALRLTSVANANIQSVTSNDTFDFFHAGGARASFEIEGVTTSGFTGTYVGIGSVADDADSTFTHPAFVDEAAIFLQLTNSDNFLGGGTGGALLVDKQGGGDPTVLESWTWASVGVDITQPLLAEIFADESGYELYFNGSAIPDVVGEWNGFFSEDDWLGGARIFANYQGGAQTFFELGAVSVQQFEAAAVPEPASRWMWAACGSLLLLCAAKWRLRRCGSPSARRASVKPSA